MQLLAIITPDIHRTALEEASRLGRDLDFPPGTLYTPLDDDMRNWIDRIWDSVLAALNHASLRGMEAARPLFGKVAGEVEELKVKLRARADQVMAAILVKLDLYLQRIIDAALNRVRPSIVLGEKTYKIAKISMAQRTKLSGSLVASLEEICSVIAEGDLAVNAEYVEAG